MEHQWIVNPKLLLPRNCNANNSARTLIFTKQDKQFEGFRFLESNPEILDLIDHDIDRLAKNKKWKRIEDYDWNKDLTDTMPRIDIAKSGAPDPDSLYLEVRTSLEDRC